MTIFRPLAAGLSALAVVVMAVPAGVVAEDHCAPAVERKLQSLGLGSSDVREANYIVEDDSMGTLMGVRAWLRLKSCATGYLVLDMHLDCGEIQTFTDGPCRVPGVPEG